MAQKGKYPSLERQWRKLMYAFYDYLPMQYKNASARDWQIRHLVWDFKDGRAYESVAEITASALVRFFGKETRNIVLHVYPLLRQRRTRKDIENSRKRCAVCQEPSTHTTISVSRETAWGCMSGLTKKHTECAGG